MNDTVGQVIELLQVRRLKGERRVWLGQPARAALFASGSAAPSVVRSVLPPSSPLTAVRSAGPAPLVVAHPTASAERKPPVPVPLPSLAATLLAGGRPSVSQPPPPPGMALPSLDLAGRSLEELRELVAACTRCDLCRSGRRQTVFADGDPKAELMFIGEGPGEEEDRQGLPFVGAAGQLLTKMIEAMKFQRREVYICNIVKCRPPDNRQPTDHEGKACLPYVLRQLAVVKPRCLVLLGNTPLWHLLAEKGITRLRGQWRQLEGIPVMLTYHPAFLLRLPAKKRECWADLQQVMKVFGKLP
ncbi:MAG: uracil-DNA glycosylase [bacterium]